MDEKQQIQDELYSYPYHHIAYFAKDNFLVGRGMRWAHEYLGYIKFVLDIAEKHNFSSLLDVGCGDGKLLLEAKQRFQDKKITGIDYSQKAIWLASAICQDVDVFCGDITKNILGDKKYDIITIVETLEHIPLNDTNDFLASIYSHLNDDGILIITVPSKNVPLQRKHYQHFSIDTLAKTLSSYFEISETWYINQISRRSEILKRLFVNRFFILNYQFLLNFLFKYHMKNMFFGNNKNTKQICVMCKKK